MSYASWSVVFGEQPSAAKWNILGTNDASFNALIQPDSSAVKLIDSNGNEILRSVQTASAVNELTLTNAATGGNPLLQASGGDTNISNDLRGKGTGGVLVDLRNQNHNAESFNNLTTAALRIEYGWAQANGDGASTSKAVAVTFPTAFSSAPVVVTGGLAFHTSSAASDITGFTSSGAPGVAHGSALSISTSGFTMEFTRENATSWSSGDRMGCAWIAIGPA